MKRRIQALSIAALLILPTAAFAQQDSELGSGEICTNTCRWAGDGECDDGGVGAQYRVCSFGSDCNDCGSRNESQHRGLRALGGLPFGDSFRVGLGVGLYSADHEDSYSLDGHKNWIPLVTDGLHIGIEARYVGLVRHTFAGNHAGYDVRFGVDRFAASIDDETEVSNVEDGQLRYGMHIDPLLRFDRPIGRRHGLTLTFGPGFSLYGVSMIAEFSPRIGVGRKLAVEPRIGVMASTYADRELRFGADISGRVSQKLSLVASFMTTLGEMVRGTEHSYTHHDITISVGF